MSAAGTPSTAAESTRKPLNRLRRAIAQGMSASARVPQFTLEADADMSVLAALRTELASSDNGFSYSDVLVAATARTLVEHPNVNASFDEDAIVEHHAVNIGIAISVPDGLVAPAIFGASRLGVRALEAERMRLTAAAQHGKLTPSELLSATFTISNLGPFGIRRFRALVVPPQAAILAVGAITTDMQMSLSLSCDHRVLDGAPAAQFLSDVRARLEVPDWVVGVL